MPVEDGEEGIFSLQPIPASVLSVLLERKQDSRRLAKTGGCHEKDKPVILQGEPLDAIAEKDAWRNGGKLQFCLKKRRFHDGSLSVSNNYVTYDGTRRAEGKHSDVHRVVLAGSRTTRLHAALKGLG